MLSNVELIKLISDPGKPIISNISDFRFNRSDSLVQPASIDLTVGEIWLPPSPNDKESGTKRALALHTLKHGETVLVVTREKLSLPDNIGGLMFPKNGRFALRGLMITNFGHVDPGYEGHLKYTVINFGSDSYRIEEGQRITSLVLFQLAARSSPTWSQISRNDPDNISGHAKVLSRDFLDIEKRIENLVELNVESSFSKRNKMRDFIFPMILSTMTILVTLVITIWIVFGTYYTHLDSKIFNIQNEIRELK